MDQPTSEIRTNVLTTFRKDVAEVADALRVFDQVLDVDTLLEICERARPSNRGGSTNLFFCVFSKLSFLGMPGGQLFQDFVEMQGNEVSLVWLKEVCEGMDTELLTREEQLEKFALIVDKEKNTFLGFMLSAFAKVSNHAKARQYLCTSSAVHHGLSRQGHNLQAQLGYLMKQGCFDGERTRHLASASLLARFNFSPSAFMVFF